MKRFNIKRKNARFVIGYVAGFIAMTIIGVSATTLTAEDVSYNANGMSMEGASNAKEAIEELDKRINETGFRTYGNIGDFFISKGIYLDWKADDYSEYEKYEAVTMMFDGSCLDIEGKTRCMTNSDDFSDQDRRNQLNQAFGTDKCRVEGTKYICDASNVTCEVVEGTGAPLVPITCTDKTTNQVCDIAYGGTPECH